MQKLQRDFPDSLHNKKYGFLAELSELRQAVRMRESSAETGKALGRVREFVAVYQGDPMLKEREADLWETLDFLAGELTRLAETEKSSDLIERRQGRLDRRQEVFAPRGHQQGRARTQTDG